MLVIVAGPDATDPDQVLVDACQAMLIGEVLLDSEGRELDFSAIGELLIAGEELFTTSGQVAADSWRVLFVPDGH